jgi:hypothetical protein
LLAQHRYQRSNVAALHDPHRRLTKVDFIWVNRSIHNFEWFLKLLSSFEQEQELDKNLSNTEEEETKLRRSRFLDIHLYFTDVKKENSIGFFPLNLVARVYEQACQQDIFTHLKAKTHVGRPEWSSLFDKILGRDDEIKKIDADVFFCGPKTMADTIKIQCNKHKIGFHQEEF